MTATAYSYRLRATGYGITLTESGRPARLSCKRDRLLAPRNTALSNTATQPVKCAVMKTDIWTPHVTVAALIERGGRFLLVEEQTSNGLRINQPAGHLEAGETLIDAVIRETLEETTHPFEPEALVGVYLAHSERPANAPVTYLRFAFYGHAGNALTERAFDAGIVRTLWLSPDELRACTDRHRSPTVMRCVDDYLAGHRMPLKYVYTHSVAPKPAALIQQGDSK